MDLGLINPKFQELETDYLYHLGLDNSMDLEHIFSGVKYVILTRSNEDVSLIARQFAKVLYNILEDDFIFTARFKVERYHLYKVGPILTISYGLGMPSMLICLNEITKLMAHMSYTDVVFFKIAPAGGLGCTVGDVVVTDEAVNTKLEPYYTNIECGVEHSYPTQFNSELIADVLDFNHKNYTKKINISVGKSIAAMDFYEETGRLDGALDVDFTLDEQREYFERAMELGIKSIDLESTLFAGFCNQLGIRACALSYVVVDRLQRDEVLSQDSNSWPVKEGAFHLIIQYITHKLGLPTANEKV